MSRLPTPGSDDNVWGNILNDFLAIAHNSDGSLQTSALQQAGGVTSVNGKKPVNGALSLNAIDVGAPTVLPSLNDVSIITPADNQVLTYNSTNGKWTNQNSLSGVTLDTTASDIQPLGGQAAGNSGLAADAKHVHAMPRLDQIGGPTANVSLNSHKITNLTNGTAATDAAAFGQIPASLPPNGSAGGDLSGTYPNPIVTTTHLSAGLPVNQGGTGQITQQTALDALAGGNTSGSFLRGNGTHVQLSAIQLADVPTLNQNTTGTAANITDTLDQVPAPAASVSLNSHKITNLTNGTASSDAAAFGQIPTAGTSGTNYTAGNASVGGDLSGTLPNPTVAKINGVTVGGTPSSGQLLMATGPNAASWQTGGYLATAAQPSGDSSGATDANSINGAITAASLAGGGQIILQAGTYYINASIIIQPHVSIIGAGRGTTIIQLANGANCDVLQSVNFSSLTHTGAATFGSSGAFMFELRGFTVDGNRANQSGVSFGIRIYGYAWIMRDLEIRNAYTDGVYTEWGLPSGSPDVLFFECRAYDVSIHDNGANGWHHCGPTDCQFSEIIIYDNNAAGGPCSIGFWNDADNASNGSGTFHFSSAALQLINGHIWGGAHTWGIVADGSLIASNCEIEGASAGQLLVRNGVRWTGGVLFYPGSQTTINGLGIQLGDSGATAGLGSAPNFPASVNLGTTQSNISTTLVGFMCDSAIRSAVNWVNSSRCSIDALAYVSSQLSATVASGSNGVDISTFTNGSPGTLNVIQSAPNLPPSGTVSVATASGSVTCTYTGNGGTALTGVVATGSPPSGSTVSTGGAIVLSPTSWGTVVAGGTPDAGSRVRIQATGGISPSQRELSSLNFIPGRHKIDIGSQLNGFTVRNDGAALDLFNVNSLDNRVETVNGQMIRMYKNSYANPVLEMDGSGGSINFGSAAGTSTDTFLSRPVAGQLNVNSALSVTGLSGATSFSRYAGSTNGGAPASGTFLIGDFVIDRTGKIWICTAAGSPGTWTAVTSPVTAPLVLQTGADTNTGIVIQANSPTQSADLQNWKDSSGNKLFEVGGTGVLTSTLASPGAAVRISVQGNAHAQLQLNNNGVIEYGDGTDSTDTFLSRSAAGQLNVNAALSVTGLTGASSASRYAGGSTNAPTSGTFATGDFVIDPTGKIWICTAGGSPGTWTQVSAGNGGVTSFNTRTGAVSPASGDYTAAQVTNAADKSSVSTQAFTGNLSVPAYFSSGLTGATAASRYVGATANGAPVSGTFAVGDYIIDQSGALWVCTAAGTPGVWIAVGTSPGGSGYLSPLLHNFAAMTLDPGTATAATQLSTSTHYVFRVVAQATQNVSKVVFYGASTQGVGCTNFYVALYNSSGNLISGSSSSTDQGSAFNTLGTIAASFGAATAVTAGSTYYISFWQGTASTVPALSRGGSSGVGNINLSSGTASATSPRWGTAANAWTVGSPYTAPATLGSITNNTINVLCGIG